MTKDETHMDRALALARRGGAAVLPNPMVGALIVRGDRIIAEGWHSRYGGPHAEATALAACREDPAGATLYVTLEPCCHRGGGKHNPPCTQAILNAGIRRVVVARPDPNPRVSGGGIAFLRERGIRVDTGVRELPAAELNRVYETLIRRDRPYVHLKAALSLDGFLAASDGSSRWISGPVSRSSVMRYRSECEGILAGKGTLFADRPSLTIRSPEGALSAGPQPLRIFLSSGGDLPRGWAPAGGDILIYHRDTASPPRREGVAYRPVGGGERGLSLGEVLRDLRARKIHRLLVEGGSRVFGSLLREGLWDKLTLFYAPILLGEGVPLSDGLGIGTMKEKQVLTGMSARPSGEDWEMTLYREAPSCLPV